jgi:hypothetical protein
MSTNSSVPVRLDRLCERSHFSLRISSIICQRSSFDLDNVELLGVIASALSFTRNSGIDSLKTALDGNNNRKRFVFVNLIVSPIGS